MDDNENHGIFRHALCIYMSIFDLRMCIFTLLYGESIPVILIEMDSSSHRIVIQVDLIAAAILIIPSHLIL